MLKTQKLRIFAILGISTWLYTIVKIYFNNNHIQRCLVNNKVNHSLMVIFMFIITISSVLSLQVQEAYATAPPTISTAVTATTTTVTVTFSEPVFNKNGVTGTDYESCFRVGGQTVTGDSLPITAIGSDANVVLTVSTPFATDATPNVDYDTTNCSSTQRIAHVASATEELATVTFSSTTDGVAPTVSISVGPLSPSEDSSVTFTWSESVTNFDVADLSVSSGTLSGFSGSGASYSVTWDLSGVSVGSDTITLAQDSGTDGNTNTGPASDTVASLSRISQPGSGCRGDCSAPTLGIDERFSRVVENGFTYNGNTINVERFFTPYPLITVDVGKQNKAVFKIYDDLGPNNIQHFDFAFGLDEGQVMGTSNAMIVWNKSTDGTETVTLVDPHNALENVRVLTSEGKCRADSTTNDCLIVTVFHTFRESLDFDIVGTNVWDFRLNAWQNFYNHGIHIEGQSLNPPDEYVGIYKGNLIHIIETGKNTAVDTDGNTWTFDNTWIKDYISIGKIDDPITSQGYDRNHVKYNTYKQGQELVASSLFETYYKTSISQEPAFSEIDDIKFYEFPDTIDKKFDPVLQAKMHQEDIRAQKYLEEMFAKMYPGLVYD